MLQFAAMKPCIFCHIPADSKEDLFPRWILKRVKTGVPLYRQIGEDPPIITDDQEVRLPCVCSKCNNTWMSRTETTVSRTLGPMIEDIAFTLDRQNQQTLTEWALKCAMINDTGAPHPRYFTDAECHTFGQKRTISDRTLAWVARFTGRSLDSNGVDFTLVESVSQEPLVRGHVYNIMVGHVVIQVLSWPRDSALPQNHSVSRGGRTMGPLPRLKHARSFTRCSSSYKSACSTYAGCYPQRFQGLGRNCRSTARQSR